MKYLVLIAVLLAAAALSFTLANMTAGVQAVRYCPRGGCPLDPCLKFNPDVKERSACNVATCSEANCWR